MQKRANVNRPESQQRHDAEADDHGERRQGGQRARQVHGGGQSAHRSREKRAAATAPIAARVRRNDERTSVPQRASAHTELIKPFRCRSTSTNSMLVQANLTFIV